MSDGSGAVETLEPVRENGRQTNGASVSRIERALSFAIPSN